MKSAAVSFPMTGIALALSAALNSPARSQTTSYDLPEKLVDQNNVDLGSVSLKLAFPVIQFGDGIRLKADYDCTWPEQYFQSSETPDPASCLDFISRGPYRILQTRTENFASGWTPLGSAAYFPLSTWEIVMPDGKAFKAPGGGRFMVPLYSASYTNSNRIFLGYYDESGNKWEPAITLTSTYSIGRVTFSDGEIWDIKYQWYSWYRRLRSVVSNRGYMIQLQYEREAAPATNSDQPSWNRPVKISGGSLAYVYCDTSGLSLCATLTSAGNSADIAYLTGGYEITHSSGFKKRTQTPNATSFSVSSPGSNSQADATVGYDCQSAPTHVGTVTRTGNTWSYISDPCDANLETENPTTRLTRTDPLGHHLTVEPPQAEDAVPREIWDELDRRTTMGGTSKTGYAGAGNPEGNGVWKTFNSRNNVLTMSIGGKQGGTLSRSFTYDQVCSNLITCNKPNTVTDARGNTTAFTYDPAHGGVLTKTGPAVNGVTPQTRYEYAQRYAWLKNSSGGYSQASSPIWMLVRERFCRTSNPSGSSCAGGAADEAVTDYDYGPHSGPNNLLLRGVAVTADGQTQRTCYGYDQMARKISETRPEAGLTACP